MSTEKVWYAVRTSGHFLRGRVYRKDQLGVLGRMAAKAGFLVPVEQETPKRRVAKASGGAVRPRSARRKGPDKEATGGEAPDPAGGSEPSGE